MTLPAPPPASDYRFLLLIIPPVFILLLATGLFEFSSNITVDNFHSLTNWLMHPTAKPSEQAFNATHFLVEVKSRYIWLTTVVLALVAGLYAFILCAMIIYQCHPRPRLLVVTAVGLVFALGGVALIWALDETHTLYRAIFGFSYDNLRQAGPQRIGEHLLRYVMVVVSIVNVQALIVPVVALLAACSTLAPPLSGLPPDPMGAWLRWPAALVADRASQEAVLGTAMAITLFWGVTFTLMLVATYLPAALVLARRAEALLLGRPSEVAKPEPEQWLKDHGLFLSLQDHFPQFSLILAPLLASPLSSLLIAPLSPTG